MCIKNFESVLEQFREVPKPERVNENIFSICGYPHYERVASNILSFFLDRSREHKLNDLFLNSIFDLLEIHPEYLNNNFDIETEVATDSGKYIDILIFNEEVSIVIENKIFAELYNDLDDYYQYISEKSNQVYGMILSITSIAGVSNPQFKTVTYEELFGRIENMLPSYMYHSDSKYLIFLLEFINSIRSLKENASMNP